MKAYIPLSGGSQHPPPFVSRESDTPVKARRSQSHPERMLVKGYQHGSTFATSLAPHNLRGQHLSEHRPIF